MSKIAATTTVLQVQDLINEGNIVQIRVIFGRIEVTISGLWGHKHYSGDTVAEAVNRAYRQTNTE